MCGHSPAGAGPALVSRSEMAWLRFFGISDHLADELEDLCSVSLQRGPAPGAVVSIHANRLSARWISQHTLQGVSERSFPVVYDDPSLPVDEVIGEAPRIGCHDASPHRHCLKGGSDSRSLGRIEEWDHNQRSACVKVA